MQIRQLVNGPEARKGKATGIQEEGGRQTGREFLCTHTCSFFYFPFMSCSTSTFLFGQHMARLDVAHEWLTCPSLCRHNRQGFALAALLSLSILIEWWASERDGRWVWLHCPESSPHFTQLRDTASIPSVLIPIQQDRLDKECGWTGVEGVDMGQKMKKKEWTVCWQGNRGQEKNQWEDSSRRGMGVDLDAHHS